LLILAGCGGSGGGAASNEQDRAVAAAKAALVQARAAGTDDLAIGPCLSEQLPGLADWVADLAHDPRSPVDDRPANQCQRFRNGEAHHFVELTPEGELIRAQ
jgi:hypothetical protein